MLVKKNLFSKLLLVVILNFVGLSLAFAHDATSTPSTPSTPSKLDPAYEPSLFESNKSYPDVELRKEFKPDCSCIGGYFGFNGGYSYATPIGLGKETPAVTNPGALNEAILSYAMSGKQYNASLTAGYKIANFRAEVSAEYKAFKGAPIASTLSGVAVDVSVKTQQLGILMSGYYDFDIEGSPISPYLGLGAGASNADTSYTLNYTTGGTTTTGSLNYNRSIGITVAAMAGVALNVSDSIVLDLGYRYMNAFGKEAKFVSSVNAGGVNTATGVNMINPGMGVNTSVTPNITEKLFYTDNITHEIRAGVRYKF